MRADRSGCDPTTMAVDRCMEAFLGGILVRSARKKNFEEKGERSQLSTPLRTMEPQEKEVPFSSTNHVGAKSG